MKFATPHRFLKMTRCSPLQLRDFIQERPRGALSFWPFMLASLKSRMTAWLAASPGLRLRKSGLSQRVQGSGFREQGSGLRGYSLGITFGLKISRSGLVFGSSRFGVQGWAVRSKHRKQLTYSETPSTGPSESSLIVASYDQESKTLYRTLYQILP